MIMLMEKWKELNLRTAYTDRVCVCVAAHGLGSNAGSHSHFYLSIDKSMGLRVGAARQTTAALLISANAAILL